MPRLRACSRMKATLCLMLSVCSGAGVHGRRVGHSRSVPCYKRHSEKFQVGNNKSSGSMVDFVVVIGELLHRSSTSITRSPDRTVFLHCCCMTTPLKITGGKLLADKSGSMARNTKLLRDNADSFIKSLGKVAPDWQVSLRSPGPRRACACDCRPRPGRA